MKKGRCIWSLALVQSLVSIKVPTGFTAALVPPHVLAEVLLTDHTAIDCPLVPHAFVGQSSEPGGRDGVHIDLLIARALVTGSVCWWSQNHWAVVSMTTSHFVHALNHSGLQAFPTR